MASPASFDLTNPGVQRMLSDERMPVAAAGKKLMQVAGDDAGVGSQVNLDIGKHEVLVYANKGDIPVLTVDVYQVEGSPLEVHVLCPRCRHNLKISQAKKAIEFNPRDANRRVTELRALGLDPRSHMLAGIGDLSVEEFECTWELESDRNVSLLSPGINLCRFRAAIDHNLLKIAR